jgi:hypothetical protein
MKLELEQLETRDCLSSFTPPTSWTITNVNPAYYLAAATDGSDQGAWSTDGTNWNGPVVQSGGYSQSGVPFTPPPGATPLVQVTSTYGYVTWNQGMLAAATYDQGKTWDGPYWTLAAIQGLPTGTATQQPPTTGTVPLPSNPAPSNVPPADALIVLAGTNGSTTGENRVAYYSVNGVSYTSWYSNGTWEAPIAYPAVTLTFTSGGVTKPVEVAGLTLTSTTATDNFYSVVDGGQTFGPFSVNQPGG